MLIRAFGLFWERDEVDWHPGHGKPFRLLGHIGERSPKLRVVDFRDEQGLYVLYSNHGPRYVGIVPRGNLGGRLRTHHDDRNMEPWNRFCWFGFCPVRQGMYPDGTRKLGRRAEDSRGEETETIRSLEAVLIHVLGTESNRQKGRFPRAKEWHQVHRDEADEYLRRVRR